MAGVLLGALAVSCGDSSGAGGTSGASPNPDATAGFDAGRDASANPPPGAGEAAADAPSEPALASIRLAHLSPDLPPVDLCLAPHGTTGFEGPLLAPLSGSDAGGAGLAFGQVSAYLSVPAGSYDAKVVPQGSDCDSISAATDDAANDASSNDAATDDAPSNDAATDDASGPATTFPTSATATVTVTLAFDTSTTLLLAGDVSPAGTDRAWTMTVLADDQVLGGGGATLRFVNAVPSAPSLDLGLGGASGPWLPLLTNAEFAGASHTAGAAAGAADANGYLALKPLDGVPLSARPSGDDADGPPDAEITGAIAAASVTVDLGSIATLFAVGGKTGDADHPPALLRCIDNQPAGGALSDCSIVH